MIDDDYLLMYLTDFLSVSSFCKLFKTCKRFQTPLVIEYLQKRIRKQYKIVINEHLLHLFSLKTPKINPFALTCVL